MKHLKLFEKFEDIDEICKKYGIRNYTINNGVVDVDGDVILRGLTKLQLKFGRVRGFFSCGQNKLTTLEGCPNSVGGNFYCTNNNLTTLLGSPKEVGGGFYCNHNQLKSLRGCPNSVGGDFNCSHNPLKSLEGCPNSVGGNFFCSYNQLTSLEGCPNRVGGDFNCSHNQLTSLEGCPSVDEYFECSGNPIEVIHNLFGSYKGYKDSLDYNYLRGTNIVKSRFKEALEEIGKTIPDKIIGYNYI